jgi:hypothetical protein
LGNKNEEVTAIPDSFHYHQTRLGSGSWEWVSRDTILHKFIEKEMQPITQYVKQMIIVLTFIFACEKKRCLVIIFSAIVIYYLNLQQHQIIRMILKIKAQKHNCLDEVGIKYSSVISVIIN